MTSRLLSLPPPPLLPLLRYNCRQLFPIDVTHIDIPSPPSWTASSSPEKSDQNQPTNPIGSRIVFLSHHFSRLHLEKECVLDVDWAYDEQD